MMSKYIFDIWEKMSRKQTFQGDIMETPLNRCLGTFSLTMLGVGSMVGSGLYVVIGEIANVVTGPAIFLSFMVAGFASGLSAWCYAEFGAQVPKAGSAYVYASLTLGEFLSFIVGWNIVLENVIGSAAISRGMIGYINAITNNSLTHINESIFGSSYDFDIFSSIPLILIIVLVSFGAKSSTFVNNCLVYLNLSIGCFIVFLGVVKGSFSNWSKSTAKDGTGTGFLPYGFQSIFKGAAQTYFAYLGCDMIAIASEECKEPDKSIPRAMAGSMAIVCGLYVSVAISLTLLVPTQHIAVDAAFPSALSYANIWWAVYPISGGALAAISSVLLGTLFAMPRCIYAMAKDGLLFKFLAIVSDSTQVPVLATIVGGAFAITCSVLLSLEELVEMISIGTLLAYIIVALSIIVLRYSSCDLLTEQAIIQSIELNDIMEVESENEITSLLQADKVQHGLLNCKTLLTNPQITTIFVFLFLQFFLSVTLNWVFDMYEEWWYILILMILLVMTIGSVVHLDAISNDNSEEKHCRVPLLPYIPCFSIFINCYLMIQLKGVTWIRFTGWTIIGLVLYFTYGIKHSTFNQLSPANEDGEFIVTTQSLVD